MLNQDAIGDEAVIFEPDFRLKEKIGLECSITELVQPQFIKNAQKVIQDSKRDFIVYLKNDVLELQKCLKILKQTPSDAEVFDHFMQLTLQIKSRGGTFGYSLASEVSRKLFVFCEEDYRANPEHILVINKYADGLSAVVMQGIEGDGGPIGRELLSSLDKLTLKFK